jgi:hypothetical protein
MAAESTEGNGLHFSELAPDLLFEVRGISFVSQKGAPKTMSQL